MKIKRIATLLLAVCLLLSMGAVPVLAEDTAVAEKTVEYSFTYYTDLNLEPINNQDYAKWNDDTEETLNDAYGDKTNSTILYFNKFEAEGNAMQFQREGLSFGCTTNEVGDYLAIKIKSPGNGNYTVNINIFSKNSASARGCDIFVLPVNTSTDDILAAIANGTALTDEAKVGNVDLRVYKTDNYSTVKTAGSYNFVSNEEVSEYIVLFKTTKAGHIRPAGMTLTKVDGVSESQVAQEISNAPIGSTIKLNAACNANGAVTVGNGATLDLNGQTLTATSLTGFKGCNVIDSTDGTATLNVAKDNLALATVANNVALWNGSAFKLYAYTLTSLNPVEDTYWFRPAFTNTAAYDLIASGNSGLQIGVDMSWTVGATDEEAGEKGSAYAYAGSSFDYVGWATAAKNNSKVAIYVTVTGTNLVDEGSFSLTPVIKCNVA